MSVKGRAVFAEVMDLRERDSKTMEEAFDSLRATISDLETGFADAEFLYPIYGAVECLLLARYKEDHIKRLVKPYAMSRLTLNLDDPDVPVIGNFQKVLYDLYQQPPIDATKDERWARYARANELVIELFEEIIREYGGQEEVEKVRRALEAEKAPKQEAHGCACHQGAVDESIPSRLTP